MPGLTLTVTDEGPITVNWDPPSAQAVLLHGPHYRAHSAVAAPGLHLGWVAYDEYPVRVFSGPRCLIYLEGRVYNRPLSAVDADLAALANVALGPEQDDAAVERFMLTNEGSYVVAVVRPETPEVLVFSDLFCRLPLYYSAEDSRLIVAREAKFVHVLRSAPAFDRVGCAQYLAFGLPLGDRTVLEGVRSFPEAGVLRGEVVDGRLRWRLRRLHAWNLDEEDRSRCVRNQARDFADLFLVACRNWGSHDDSRGNLVSLSGGHDSRGVAAGLARVGAGVVAVTYRDPNGKREDEVRCARQLTEALRIEWHCIDLPAPTQSAYEELAWLKDGMNWSSMAYILSYLGAVVRQWGRGWTYFSGDGGDDCLKVTAPRLRFRQATDVVGYILEKETCVRPDQAEAVLKLPAGTLRDELQTLFESYPEQDLARRIKHFKIFERGRRCYFEGEDRTRSFLWQDSPFYSLPLFRHCMRVPDRLKRYNVFCRQALLALSPAAAGVPVVSSGYPPASWRYALYHRAKETVLDLPRPLVTLARRLTGSRRKAPYAVPIAFTTYLRDQLTGDTALAKLLDRDQLLSTLPQIGSAHAFFCLWTVVMLEKVYRLRTGPAASRSNMQARSSSITREAR
jgi:asparagine synthase (glutamine-hydrolysing)